MYSLCTTPPDIRTKRCMLKDISLHYSVHICINAFSGLSVASLFLLDSKAEEGFFCSELVAGAWRVSRSSSLHVFFVPPMNKPEKK